MRDIGTPMSYAWDDAPALESTPWVPIYRTPVDTPLLLTLLDGNLTGVWVHSIKKRDTPCLRDGCPWKVDGVHMAARWKGYLPAWDEKEARMVLAEITAKAWGDWGRLPEPKIYPGRGHSIWMKRMAKKENAPVRLEFRPKGPVNAEDLPEPFDVKFALSRIWAGEGQPPAGV